MSSGSSARSVLHAFAAGQAPAERAVAAIAAAYYEASPSAREPLRELVGIIERAAPGIVELARADGGVGFAIRPIARPFPTAAEAELRRATRTLLDTGWGAAVGGGAAEPPPLGWWARVLRAVRGLFTAES